MNKLHLILFFCLFSCSATTAQIRTDSCIVPTIITPNDDGVNDELKIPCLPDMNTDSEIMIFNEWGDRIYYAKPYQNTWRGTYKNMNLPDGTYFYIFKMTASASAQRGHITVFR